MAGEIPAFLSGLLRYYEILFHISFENGGNGKWSRKMNYWKVRLAAFC